MHLVTDKRSRILMHSMVSDKYRIAYNDRCFRVLDSVSYHFLPKFRKALHILWEKPILNKEVQHFEVSRSF